MKLKTFLLLVGACLAGTAVGAVPTPADFANRVPLEVAGKGPWYRLQLPIEVLFGARHGDLRDLRIFNAEGEALPYSLRTGAASEKHVRSEVQARIFPLRGASGSAAGDNLKIVRSTTGTILEITPNAPAQDKTQVLRGWLLETGSGDLPLDRLQLDWAADSDGFQRLRIEASDDLEHWRSLGEGQLARLDFNGQRIEQNDIALSGETARYLRLWWESPQQAAQLAGAVLSGSRNSTGPVPMLWSAPLAAKADAEGAFNWSLPLALPVERVRIPLERANTLAPVVLSGRRDGAVQWAPLARGVLYRLPGEGGEITQEELELPGGAVSQLRLQLDARGGGLGGSTANLSIGIRATEVVFLARGGEPYQLAVGSASATDGSLPLATLVPGFDPRRLSVMGDAHLKGALQPQASVTQSAPPNADGRWKRYGLWAVLLAGVVLLGLMALSLLRSSRPQN
ncbi:hypothetical protein H681_22945 [Pseudomonas sp. ATCC 13867]|uniref:DUF3999 domain-containing protein n=1 Tax=Pseudomonas sp. ATCC 13867 TaxID=1294143 RepID=UPI0002C4EF75|nr:DUF3999 domain-containing protein [Pseudomonas sp. ATCC 13867]AGI26456.1 hypothetical protein H681_22945 [Pseudomonas sp. ATCC 13867]